MLIVYSVVPYVFCGCTKLINSLLSIYNPLTLECRSVGMCVCVYKIFVYVSIGVCVCVYFLFVCISKLNTYNSKKLSLKKSLHKIYTRIHALRHTFNSQPVIWYSMPYFVIVTRERFAGLQVCGPL